MKDNFSKTLGPKSARLVATLNSRNRQVFHLKEASKIIGNRNKTTKIVHRLVNKGIATRLKPGTYQLVPFELGFENEYLGNPYVVARELITGRRQKSQKYYLSYGSAFELHQMVTQPQFVVYISTPLMIRPRTIQGTDFRFVSCKKKDIFGITEMWIDKHEKIMVSDLERTLLDGLKRPSYCGGLSEVAKAFSIKRPQINPEKLIDYAIKLGVGAVIRRLGYLMELYDIGSSIHWQLLQTKLSASYELLDPDLPQEGHHIAKWRLRLNITEEELMTLRGT